LTEEANSAAAGLGYRRTGGGRGCGEEETAYGAENPARAGNLTSLAIGTKVKTKGLVPARLRIFRFHNGGGWEGSPTGDSKLNNMVIIVNMVQSVNKLCIC
jgi:hypothetical protein